MTHEDRGGAVIFSHPKNILVGSGRVPYANAVVDVSGNAHPEGWVLPGGRRTKDSAVAHNAALLINELSRQD
jgi:hypothetical protein